MSDSRCRKSGPYLPVGDTEWECLTHGVELVRVSGEWGTPASADQMACPANTALVTRDTYDRLRELVALWLTGDCPMHMLGCRVKHLCWHCYENAIVDLDVESGLDP